MAALPPKRALFFSIGAAVILCSVWTVLGILMPVDTRHDFLTTYTAARMASKGEYAGMHDPKRIFARMREADPATAGTPFVRPQFYAFVISPLARLPYRTAFWTWLEFQAAALLACWIWAVRRFGPGALIWGALSAPCVLGILNGQDCVSMLAIAIGGYVLAKKKWYWAAGAVLALALMKFYLVLFLAPAMLVSRRWKMLGGFAGMTVALTGACLALGGVEGLQAYAALLRNTDMERLNPTPDLMIGIQGLLANLHLEGEIPRLALGIGALAIAAFVLRERQPLWRWMSLAITASLFAAPHVYGYDAAILVLPVWLVQAYSRSSATRISFAIFATPLPFLAALAGAPWSIITPICLTVCYCALTWEAWAERRARRAQINADEPELTGLTLAEPVL